MKRPDTTETRFAAHVRDARRARGWSQEELRRRIAAGYGITLSQTAMCRLESASRPISLNEAAALADALGLEPVAGAAVATTAAQEVARVVRDVLVDVLSDVQISGTLCHTPSRSSRHQPTKGTTTHDPGSHTPEPVH